MTHLTPADLDRLDERSWDNELIAAAYPQLVAEIRRLWAEVERIGHELTQAKDSDAQNWKVISKLREALGVPHLENIVEHAKALRAENERLRAVRDVAAKVERCRGGDMPNENIIESRLLDELRTTLDAARGGA